MKPSIPKGTRDFSSEIIFKRTYIIQTIKRNFELFGFEPIETTSLENLSTLNGKYGEEGDQLTFKVLNNGDFLSDIDLKILEEKNSKKLASQISDKALRYDLTIPFARYIVQNQNSLYFPYKRYQIQTVWRADRPQKGRFREFLQCDADSIGSGSLWQEVEFILLYNAIFNDLNLKVELQLNNRKILLGLAEIAGIKDKLLDFTIALDKIDKIGKEKVIEELNSKGISNDSIEKIAFIFEDTLDLPTLLLKLDNLFSENEIGKKGVEEINFILKKLANHELNSVEIKFNLTLARGLNYYTGMIFEVKSKQIAIGSIGGGGRYDDLTGIFGLDNMSGVGISFGLDRIFIVLDELNLFPQEAKNSIQLMVLNLGEEEGEKSFLITQQLRDRKINVTFYPETTKIKKQLQFASNKKIPFILIIGKEELENNYFLLKNMVSGEQQKITSLKEIEEILLN